jgi:HD-like signal output (HDOD) protein
MVFMDVKQQHENAVKWVDTFLEHQLPSISRVGSEVLKAIQEDNLSYNKLAKLINLDPILAFKITTYANMHMHEEAEGCTTLEHAISLIGTDKLKTVTQNIPIVKESLSDICHFYYTRIVSSSLLAAQIAQEMAEIKKPQLYHDIYWSSLFSGSPLWYLWRYATPEMRLIRYAIRSNFKLPEVAEIEVLGTTIEEIGHVMMERLRAPNLIKDSFTIDKFLTPRQWVAISQHFDDQGNPKRIYDAHLNLKINDPSFIIILANLIAGHAAHDWYSNTVLRYQKVLAVWLGIPLSNAITLTHRCAAKMSRQHPLPGIMEPAAKLILPPRPRFKAEKQKTETSQSLKAEYNKTIQINSQLHSTQTEKEAAPPSQSNLKQGQITANLKKFDLYKQKQHRGNKQIFDELTHIMLHQPDNFTDLHELMNAATQGVAYGLGLHRSTVALVNAQRTRAKAYYTVGTRDDPELGKFEIDLKENNIFTRLIEKPASVWIKPESSQKTWAMVPEPFQKICKSNNFFLMSVFVGNKPVAIFYADVKGEEDNLTLEDYTQFKYICGATAHCLAEMAKNRKRQG